MFMFLLIVHFWAFSFQPESFLSFVARGGGPGRVGTHPAGDRVFLYFRREAPKKMDPKIDPPNGEMVVGTIDPPPPRGQGVARSGTLPSPGS